MGQVQGGAQQRQAWQHDPGADQAAHQHLQAGVAQALLQGFYGR